MSDPVEWMHLAAAAIAADAQRSGDDSISDSGDDHDMREEAGDESSDGDEPGDDREEDDDDDDDTSFASSQTDSAARLFAFNEEVDDREATVFQLVDDVVSSDWSDADLTHKLNAIAETLEEVESTFRKDRTPPYRRDGHLIGNLLQVLEEQEEFYPLLKEKLDELVDNKVKAAACRVLLATVPVNSRFIVRLLCDEEILDRICVYAGDDMSADNSARSEVDPPLRCYATGLLAVGLRDRSIADIVVNKDTPTKFLKRIRLYASKLEKERVLATKYIQEHAKNSAGGRQQRRSGSMSGTTQPSRANSVSLVARSGPTVKRKLSDLMGNTSDVDVPQLRADSISFQSMVRTNNGNEEAETPSVVSTGNDLLSSDSVRGSAGPSRNEDGPMGSLSRYLSGSATDDPNLHYQPDLERHEEDLKKLVLLELLYTLDCIGLMGEYLELFAPSQKEDIIGTIVTFLHSKNATVISHTLTMTSHFLVHKRFAFSLIDAGGVELIFSMAKTQHSTGQLGLLDRSLSMCLHGLASLSTVIEKILSADPETLLSVSFGLLSSPNDRARQNAVVFFGLTMAFRVVLEYFEKQNGLYTLLNIIRAGNEPKSTVQRQLSHDACLCLRQYLRVHMTHVTYRLRRKLSQVSTHHTRGTATTGSTTPTSVLTAAPALALARLPARVPKLSWHKPVDIDDKTHQQNLVFYEKYRFSVPSNSGSSGSSGSWSAATGAGGTMWSPAAKLSHLKGILVMLEVIAMMSALIQSGDPEETSNTIRVWMVERSQFCLECLQILTLVAPALANEVCTTVITLEEVGVQKRAGLTILLELAMSRNLRDSDLVRDVLRLFCNCVSPPHSEDCWQHPHKDIRQYTLTARPMRKHVGQESPTGAVHNSPAEEENTFHYCCSRVRDDKALRPVRKFAREKNAIKVCVHLLRYKRSVQNADAIRLLATRALLGLSRDRHIAQILQTMQLGQLLSDLIRQDPVLEENADLHVRFRESALDLISQVTHRAPNAVINEATDPTVRKIEKAGIVAQTRIAYDENELLQLIHSHLVAKGFTASAAALQEEAKVGSGVSSPSDAPKTPEPRQRRISKNRSVGDVASSAAILTSSWNGEVASNAVPEDILRPSKIPRLSSQPISIVPGETNSRGSNQTSAFDQGVPSKVLGASGKIHGPAWNASQRLKIVRHAFRTPHLFSNCASTTARAKRPSYSASASQVSTQRPVICSNQRSKSISLTSGRDEMSASTRSLYPSRLDDIICHYLREQHRQCANPVSTVPPFKLIGPDAVHRCPDPMSASKTPLNIFSRLSERCRTGFRFGTKALSNPCSDAGINRYIYSRYRPHRVIGTKGYIQGGVSVARFYGGALQSDVMLGTHHGELLQVHISSDTVVNTWTCHSSMIADIESNAHTRMGSANHLMVTASLPTLDFQREVALWDVNSMEFARWRFAGGMSPRFNNFGDRVVALDARQTTEDGFVDEESNDSGAVMVDIATGNVLCTLKDAVQSNEYKHATNCCFAPDDSSVLTGGMLWDTRIPTRALYKFDKLSNIGMGYFHPNGNEVIINSAVWDLRTFQLLRMVPALDKAIVRFSSTGAVIFAYAPRSLECQQAKSWFRVLDARDYRDISTVELERPIYDLAVGDNSSQLCVVEGRYQQSETAVYDEPVCRLYEIGRKRPSEDDSDVEDEHSDTMDDDEFDDESGAESDGDEDDEDDEGDEEDDESDDGGEDSDENELDDVSFMTEDDEDEGSMEDGDSDSSEIRDGAERTPSRRAPSRGGSSVSARDIQLLLGLPETNYYGMHDAYSSDDG